MPVFTVRQAKTHFSELVARAEAGEEIVIARGKQPAVRLVPIPKRPRPKAGALKGKVYLTDAFFEPLPEEEFRAWEGDAESGTA